VLSPIRHQWTHEPWYRSTLDLHSNAKNAVIINSLIIFDDYGLNFDRIRRLNSMRFNVRNAINSNKKYKFVYLKRDDVTPQRKLQNSRDFEEFLLRRDFSIISPETDSLDSILEHVYDADIIVLTEGSAQNHVLLSAKEGAIILTIQPPRRFNAMIRSYFVALGMKWVYFVGDDQLDGFSVDLKRLEKLINKIS
jgi:capsular polysaccharide biosynthesis protein